MAAAGQSKTSKHYRKNASSAAKKRAYDRAYSKRTKGSQASGAKKNALKKKDSERWSARRKAGIAGKGGPDMSHTKSGRMVKENATKNRARNGKNGKSTKK
jgi:hypothetical protein